MSNRSRGAVKKSNWGNFVILYASLFFWGFLTIILKKKYESYFRKALQSKNQELCLFKKKANVHRLTVYSVLTSLRKKRDDSFDLPQLINVLLKKQVYWGSFLKELI